MVRQMLIVHHKHKLEIIKQLLLLHLLGLLHQQEQLLLVLIQAQVPLHTIKIVEPHHHQKVQESQLTKGE